LCQYIIGIINYLEMPGENIIKYSSCWID